MEVGLLILRTVIGTLFVAHGVQKLFGWFGGPGLEGTSGMFGSAGYRWPRLMAVVAGLSEGLAGALLVLGFLTPFAAAVIVGVMINAIVVVHAPNGPWFGDGGYEYNLVLIAAVVGLAFTGPGLWSIDGAAGLSLDGRLWGATALVVGVLASVVVLGLRRTSAPPAAVPEPTAEPSAAIPAEQPEPTP